MVLISSSVAFSDNFSKYVCMCDFSMLGVFPHVVILLVRSPLRDKS